MSNGSVDPLDIGKTLERPSVDKGGYLLAAGQSLGQYRIVRTLGRGGMGEVYEAEHQVLRRRYALKLLPADLMKGSNALQRFQREAQVMANLEHPGIVRVDDFGETDGRYWLRMGLAEGLRPAEDGDRIVTLADLAEALGGKIPQEALLPVLRQVLEALDYAHGHGAVHRDLKPSNILLTAGNTKTHEKGGDEFSVVSAVNNCTAKISDFGLVRLVGEEWLQLMVQLSVQQSMSMGDEQTVGVKGGTEGSSTRSMLGTYAYMSPEQKRGEEADARSDIYSVGLMAFRLLTGRELGTKPPSRIDRTLAASWDVFVEQALEEEPVERLASALDGLSLLENVEREIYEVLAKPRRTAGPQAVTSLDSASSYVRDTNERQSSGTTAHAESEQRETEVAPVLKKAEIERTAGETQIVDLGGGVRLELVWCPPGTFTMGSPRNEQGRNEDEVPHEVTLSKGFWMGKHEVTQAQQWKALTGWDTSCFKRKNLFGFGGDTKPSHPVESVSWHDCQTFIQKLNARVSGGGFRLPTEAEWEYACRAGTTTAFHYGNDFDATMANFNGGGPYGNGGKGEYRRTTMPVGSFQPNAWGLYDMHGNVWEWCQDWYGDYPTGSVTDPTGPYSGSFRVLRGGSWLFFDRFCRSANRYRFDPGLRYINVGLRLARDPQ